MWLISVSDKREFYNYIIHLTSSTKDCRISAYYLVLVHSRTETCLVLVNSRTETCMPRSHPFSDRDVPRSRPFSDLDASRSRPFTEETCLDLWDARLYLFTDLTFGDTTTCNKSNEQCKFMLLQRLPPPGDLTRVRRHGNA